MSGALWRDATVVVTGGTGSFGRAFTRRILREPIRSLRILSRDELKQSEMRRDFVDSRMRFIIGDVRDPDGLRRNFQGADIVIHAAALKRVDAGEYNPIQFVKTNVDGAENVLSAAIDAGVRKVMALSSDKAVNPANLYGATKLLAERLFIAANNLDGTKRTRLSCVRYGNVAGSRGSLLPAIAHGSATLTDIRMTRFFMRLSESVELVKTSLERMEGEEVFIPKLPSVRIVDVFSALAPDSEPIITGIRAGEKLHELLIGCDESRQVEDAGDRYVVWTPSIFSAGREFSYSSETNPTFLSVEQIREAAPLAMVEAA